MTPQEEAIAQKALKIAEQEMTKKNIIMPTASYMYKAVKQKWNIY